MTAPDGTGLARGMAWFGIGLGAAELLAPGLLSRTIGIRAGAVARTAIRAIGLRELVTGVVILLRRRRPRAVWARVAGDAVDLAGLGTAIVARRTSTPRALAAVAAVGGAAALDAIAARRVQRAFDASNPPIVAAVTINRPVAEVYAFCRDLDRLLPRAGKVRWTTELVEDVPDQRIAWRARTRGLAHEGRVTFARAPGRATTEVRVELRLGVAGAGPSAELARLFARPLVRGDLRRLKQLLETGEVLRSDASVHVAPHPARPAPDVEPAPAPAFRRSPTAEKAVTP